jgi:hypothetical protein
VTSKRDCTEDTSFGHDDDDDDDDILTPWCRTFFEKLIVTQLVKKILLSYGTRKFITVLTKARHWTPS